MIVDDAGGTVALRSTARQARRRRAAYQEGSQRYVYVCMCISVRMRVFRCICTLCLHVCMYASLWFRLVDAVDGRIAPLHMAARDAITTSSRHLLTAKANEHRQCFWSSAYDRHHAYAYHVHRRYVFADTIVMCRPRCITLPS